MPETVAECPLSDRDVSLAEVQPPPAHTFIYHTDALRTGGQTIHPDHIRLWHLSPRTDAGERVEKVETTPQFS